MKRPKIFAFLLAAIFFSSALITLTPAVAALTWDTVYLSASVNCVSTNCSGQQAVAVNGDVVMVIKGICAGTVASCALRGYRSDDGGVAFDPYALDLAAGMGSHNDIDNFGNRFVICYSDETASDLRYLVSSDDALNWGTGLGTGLIDAGIANNQGYCNIELSSQAAWHVAYYNRTTNNHFSYTKTTDSGVTWSTPVTIATKDLDLTNTGNKIELLIDPINSDNLLFTFDASGPTGPDDKLWLCRSTNGGTSWTCKDHAPLGNGGFAITPFGNWGNFYFYVSTNDAITQYTTTDSGASSVFRPSIYSTTTHTINGIQAHAFSEDEVGLSFVACTSTCSGDIHRWIQTADAGVTWTTEEVIGDGVGTKFDHAHMKIAAGKVYFAIQTDSWSSNFVYRDVFVKATYSTSVNEIGASATATVTSLVGASVSPAGTGLIARTDGGDYVRSFNPRSSTSTLSELGNDETNCNAVDRVLADEETLAYIDCTAGGTPEFFRIRAFTGTPLSQPELGCDVTDECLTDIDLDNNEILCANDAFTDAGGMQQLQFVLPLDYSAAESQLSEDNRYAAWAYGTSSGIVGVAEYTTQGGCDDYNEERVIFSGTAVTDMCTTTKFNSRYIAAINSASGLKVYQWTPDFGDSLDGTLTLLAQYNSIVGGSVACAWRQAGSSFYPHLFVQVQEGATQYAKMLNLSASSDASLVIWSAVITSAASRSVAFSENGEWVFWKDGLNIKLAYSDNGTVVGTFVAPTGTWKSMATTSAANDLYAFSSTTIAWYDVDANIDDVPTGCSGICSAPTTQSPIPSASVAGTGSNAFGGAGSSLATAFGLSVTAGDAFLGVIVMILVAAAGAGLFRTAPLAGGTIGAIIGFVVAGFASLFPPAVMYGTIVLVGGLVIVAFKR